MTVSNESRPAAVYRLYDAEGELLYIGSAYDPNERCRRHRQRSWWSSVVRRTEEWHPGRRSAYLAEMNAIAAEVPKHNRFGKPGYTTPQTEAVLQRNELMRVRGRVEAESWKVRRETVNALTAQGLPWEEVSAAGRRARFAHLEASGLFPDYVAREKARQIIAGETAGPAKRKKETDGG